MTKTKTRLLTGAFCLFFLALFSLTCRYINGLVDPQPVERPNTEVYFAQMQQPPIANFADYTGDNDSYIPRVYLYLGIEHLGLVLLGVIFALEYQRRSELLTRLAKHRLRNKIGRMQLEV